MEMLSERYCSNVSYCPPFQNIDLHALTGWIPERIPIIRNDPLRFKADKEFKKLYDHFHKGNCLVTLATGNVSDAEADRAGLVSTHAYAMLDIREINVVLSSIYYCSQCLTFPYLLPFTSVPLTFVVIRSLFDTLGEMNTIW